MSSDYATQRELVKVAEKVLNFELDWIVTGNGLYTIQHGGRRIILTQESHDFKGDIIDQVQSGFTEDEINRSRCIHLGIRYNIPRELLETKDHYLQKKYDITNLTKVFEDAIFEGINNFKMSEEGILDDSQVVKSVLEKTLSKDGKITYDVTIEIYGIASTND